MLDRTSWRISMNVLAAFLAVGLARRAARAEIPAGDQVPTSKQYFAKQMAFDTRVGVDAYSKHGVRNPKWDADAVAFMKGYILFSNAQSNAPSAIELERQGRLLYLNGCDDPLVQFMYGRILVALGRAESARGFVTHAADNLIKQGYAPTWQAAAGCTAYRLLYSLRDINEANKYQKVAANALPELFKSKTYTKEDRAVLASHVYAIDELLTAAQKKAAWEAAKNVPDADPVALLLMEGQYHISAAWEARGAGLAGQVAPKGWQGFNAHLNEASRALTKAWDMDHTAPEPAVAMITVAMGSGGAADMRQWFDRATSARLDDEAAYSSFIYGMYPRWNGDRRSLMAFGEECFDTKRFDTKVPIHYLDVLLAVRNECDDGDMSSWSKPEIYNRVKELLDRSLAPGGAVAGNAHYRSIEAAFCARAEHWEDARNAIEALKGPLDPGAMSLIGMNGAEVLGMSYAFSGPGSEAALKGRDLAAGGKRLLAIEQFQAAMKAKKDEAAKRYVRGRIQVLRWESDFIAGKQVTLKADKDGSGFHNAFGTWKSDFDGGILAFPQKTEQLDLICDADFGDEWELRADVDFLRTTADWTATGITLAAPGDGNYLGLELNPHDGNFIARYTRMDAHESKPAPVKKHNQIILRRQGKRLVMFINGQSVYTADAPDDAPGHRLRIGFGGWPIHPGGDVVRFRNLRVRIIREGL